MVCIDGTQGRLLEERGLGRANELVSSVPEVEALSRRLLHGTLHVLINELHVLGLRNIGGLLG